MIGLAIPIANRNEIVVVALTRRIPLRFRFDSNEPVWPPSPSRQLSDSEPSVLDRAQCIEFLKLVHDGLGQTMACAQLGIDARVLRQTLIQRPSFRRALEQVEQALSDNLFSILYAAALKGDTRAAQFLLARQDRQATRRDSALDN